MDASSNAAVIVFFVHFIKHQLAILDASIKPIDMVFVFNILEGWLELRKNSVLGFLL